MSNTNIWIQASPLKSGQLSQDNYSYTITGLSANTIYEYRAYAIIDGTPYYGEVENIMTCYDISTPPTVITGCAFEVTTTTMRMCNNVVTADGGIDVCEYGILYSQNPSYSTSNTLLYNTSQTPTVCMKSTCASIPTGQTYYLASSGEICNLVGNTMTYYRAFAINDTGVGYGTVKCQLTNPIVYPTKTVNLIRTEHPSINCSSGLICMSPALSENEVVSIIVNVEDSTAIYSVGNTTTEITCSSGNGESVPVVIYSCSTTSGLETINDIIIPIISGDVIAWSQSVNGDSGSYATIKVCGIESTTCINAIISDTDYCNVSYSSTLSEFA